MAAIYANAVFTVAAVDGTRLADAGTIRRFLSQAELFRDDDDHDRWVDPERAYRTLSETGNFTARQDGELDTRRWGFQEKMLSRPLFSLTQKGVFWDCLYHSASGQRPSGILGDFSFHFRDSDDRAFKRVLFST